MDYVKMKNYSYFGFHKKIKIPQTGRNIEAIVKLWPIFEVNRSIVISTNGQDFYLNGNTYDF